MTSVRTVESITYDAKGRPVERVVDAESPVGTVVQRSVEWLTYDTRGRLLTVTSELRAGTEIAILILTSTYAYTKDSTVITTTTDEGADGTVESTTVTTRVGS